MMMFLIAQLCTLHLSFVNAAVVSRQIRLADREYFVPATPAWKLNCANKCGLGLQDEFVPLTVIRLHGSVDPYSVREMFGVYKDTDDVWGPEFARTLYIQSGAGYASDGLRRQLASEYNVSKVIIQHTAEKTAIGPYFVHAATGNVYQAYRLYADTNQAFVQSTYQDSNREHYPLRAAIASAAGLTIAVPSRLYAAPSPEKPLAGVRIAVKDLFDLKGVKTGGGNRAYYQTSSVRNRTAASVERLIDAGAIVVGKTKLSEFAFGGPYVTDHIDYLLPFNPRGDGRNSPSDSSGGSGASVASYEWLDASLGSDTGGSIRGPAAWNGVYGNRPSHGAVDLAGTIPLSPSMDTVGTLTRDPELWNTINNVLYAGAFQKYLDLPKKILLDPESSKQISSLRSQYPNITGEIDKFLNKLTQIMSGKISTFSVDDAWNKSTPAAFNTTRLASAVDLIYSKLTLYEQWNIFGKDFVKEYMETHSGDFPPMLPAIRQGWVIVNASLTQRGHQGDLRDKAGVADWVAKNFLVSDTKTCSNALYVYFTFPTTSYKLDVAKEFRGTEIINPNLRVSTKISVSISNPSIAGLQSTLLQQKIQLLTMNVTINCNTTLGSEELCKNSTKILSDATTKPVNPVYVGRLASIADLPDYTVPLGSFDLGELTSSKSTLRNQSLPLAVNLVAAKGCDLMLLDLIHKLYRRGAIRGAGVGSII